VHVYVASSLARCSSCRENLRGQGWGNKAPSYRCASRDRHISCAAQRRSIPAAAVDRDLGTFVQQLRLPDAWQAVVLAEIGADDDAAAQVAQRRARLHADLERAQQYLLSGYITEEQFRAKRAEIQVDLAALQPLAEEVDLDEAAARLKDLGRTWADATDEERREIARAFFEAVYCDLDRKQVIAVKMKSTLSPFKSVLSRDDAPNSDVPAGAQSCRNAEPTGFEPAISHAPDKHGRSLHHGLLQFRTAA
jgi:hypothetical protein